MNNNRPFVSVVDWVRKTKSLHEEYPPDNGPIEFNHDYPDPIVSEIIDTEYEIFNGTMTFVPEKDLFPSKEELVMSLLK